METPAAEWAIVVDTKPCDIRDMGRVAPYKPSWMDVRVEHYGKPALVRSIHLLRVVGGNWTLVSVAVGGDMVSMTGFDKELPTGQFALVEGLPNELDAADPTMEIIHGLHNEYRNAPRALTAKEWTALLGCATPPEMRCAATA